MTMGIVMTVAMHDDFGIPMIVMMGVGIVLAVMTHVGCDGHAGVDGHGVIDAMMISLAIAGVRECSSSARGAPTIPELSAPGTCDMPSSLWALSFCHFLI